MATQTNVKFSRVSIPIADALAQLQEEAFDPLRIELRKFARIQPTGEDEFPGYDVIGRPLDLRSIEAVLDEVGRGESFGLGYLVGVPAYIYLNFFDFDDAGYSALLTFDSSVLYFRDDKSAQGQLLERILSRTCDALDVDVCGYNSSDRYIGEFDALAVAEIVDGVRSGELLRMEQPFFYAIKADHLTTESILSAIPHTLAKHKRLGRYHVLSAWPR
ncbi:MAG: hypothetical protein JNK05_03045 [Myxococcales bacterium]|nr:hypothetical protein [Myxococcales bacterium]